MSMPFALVILIVVIVVTAGVGYFGLQSVKPTSTTIKSCSPASACKTNSMTNDVTLFTPYNPGYGQTMISIDAGAILSATVGVTGSETIKSYQVAWGDGSIPSSGPTATFTHRYASPGVYVIAGSAVDTKGVTHTGIGALIPVSVTPTLENRTSGYLPSLSTTLQNGSTGGGVYPWLGVGSTVTVNGSYSSAPPNPLWTASAPTLTAGTGVTQKTYTHGSTWATGTYTFGTTGTYSIVLSGTTSNGTATLPFTYTWSFYVAATAAGLGCSSCKIPVAKSPHTNELVVYEVAPSGAVTLDPAGDYYTIGGEVSVNTFQTLIVYNGTDEGPTPNGFIPDAATCVPGSGQCAAMYPGTNGLVSGNNTTFVISANDNFYDPATGKTWGVYPSDVMFSFLRQMMYADGSVTTTYPGWIMDQALLGPGNPSYDNNGPGGAAVHYPYNNTPARLLDSMFVNDSAFCPASAMTDAHGCITLDTTGSGYPQPALLDYVTHSTAGAIQSCGWYTAQGTGVPGFSANGAADAPCWLPGHSSSTSQSSFTSFAASQSDTAWDTQELAGQGNYSACGTPFCATGFNEVGSGPYGLVNANPTVGYVLGANPGWVQPAGCAGQSYCLPVKGDYASKVIVYYDDSDTQGIQELSAGYADFANIEPADAGSYLALAAKGQVGLSLNPTTSTFNYGFNLNIGLTTLAEFDPYKVNIQSNSFDYVGLRDFLAQAYPYASVDAQYNVYQGIEFGFNFGGFIPEYFGNYYPTNVSWPGYNATTQLWSDPSTASSSSSIQGSAAWYWKQLTTASSPFYDPQFGPGGYSASNPLHIPAIAQEGDPTHFAILELWDRYVTEISGGAVVFDTFYVATGVLYEYLVPGSPWALWLLGWAADYAQPYDYWAAYGAAAGAWTTPDGVYTVLSEGAGSAQFNSASCDGATAIDSFATLFYWADQASVPQDCQGVAYNVTLYWASYANHDANVVQGQLIWNRVDALFASMNLYVNTEQQVFPNFYAPWINPSTLDLNGIQGFPAEESVWYFVNGNGVLS
jgi:hypothetical protein